MARGPQVDQGEFFDVADRLAAEGKPVTALAIHSALGRGSLTTVYKHLDDWKATRPAKVTVGNTDIPEPVKNAFAVAWRAAAQEAAKDVEDVKARASAEVKEAQAQFYEVLEALDRLEKDNEAAREEISALKSELVESNLNCNRLESDCSAKAAAEAELRRQTGNQKEEIERLQKELERERAERDVAIKEAAELRGAAQSQKAQYDDLLAKLGDKLK